MREDNRQQTMYVGSKFARNNLLRNLEIGKYFTEKNDSYEIFNDLIEEFFSDELEAMVSEVKMSLERTSKFSINPNNKYHYTDIKDDMISFNNNIGLLNFNHLGKISHEIISKLISDDILSGITSINGKFEISLKVIDEINAIIQLLWVKVKQDTGVDKLFVYIPDVVFWTITPTNGSMVYAIFQSLFNWSDGLIIYSESGTSPIVDRIAEVLKVKIEISNFKNYANDNAYLNNFIQEFISYKNKYEITYDDIGELYLRLPEISELIDEYIKFLKVKKEDLAQTHYNAIVRDYLNWVDEFNSYPKELKSLMDQRDNLEFVINLLPTDNLKKVLDNINEEISNYIYPTVLKFGINSFVQFLGTKIDIPGSYHKYLENKEQDALDIKNTIDNFDRLFNERVIGQEQVIKPLWNVLKRWFIGIRSNKPVGSFLMVGPTGVGKTETAKFLADKTFGNLIVLDMSEYQSEIDKTKIIGVAPGYSGYDQGAGVLDKVAANPRSVILFDEIEKAHPLIFDLLLQLLDEGRLTDHKGNEVSFKECLIICTTNAHYGDIEHLGSNTRAKMIEILSITFRKEFLARFSDVLKYKFLNEDVMGLIFDKKIKEELNVIASSSQIQNITIIEDENYYKVKTDIIGFMDHSLGARELSRVINEKIIAPLIELVIDLGSDLMEKEFYFDTVGVLKWK